MLNIYVAAKLDGRDMDGAFDVDNLEEQLQKIMNTDETETGTKHCHVFYHTMQHAVESLAAGNPEMDWEYGNRYMIRFKNNRASKLADFLKEFR